MAQRHPYLLIGSLDDETFLTEWLPLSRGEGSVRNALQAAMLIGDRICEAMVPVETDGPPDGPTTGWAR